MKHKRSELTRAKIVAAARQQFLEKGIDNTAIAEICRMSGVSNGALFHQFPVKEDLAFAVYSEVRLDYWTRVVGALTGQSDPLAGIESAVRTAFRFQQDEPGAAALMSDVTGSKWLERYAQSAQPMHDAITARAMAWAAPHIQSGRLPSAHPDVFIALVSGAPQWIGRIVRVGLATSTIDEIAEDLSRFVRRAFEPR